MDYLQLHLAHELHANFLQPFVPCHMQRRVGVLELSQRGKSLVSIHAFRQHRTVGEHRLQYGGRRACLNSKPIAGVSRGKARNGADHACRRLIHRLVLCAGIDAYLIRLFSPAAAVQYVLYLEAAGGYLHVCQTGALRIVGYFEYACSEFIASGRLRGVFLQTGKQLLYALQLQRGTEEAGEHLPLPYGLAYGVGRHCTCIEVLFHHILAAHGKAIVKFLLWDTGREIYKTVAHLFKPAHELLTAEVGYIHFVYKYKGGHAVPAEQLEQRLGMGLYALRAADYQQGVVQHA